MDKKADEEKSYDNNDTIDVPVIEAFDPGKLELDPTGYFKIALDMERMLIQAKHYSYDKEVLRIIQGKDAESICHTIIINGWASTLDHAAYLGQELARAEIAMRSGYEYVQG